MYILTNEQMRAADAHTIEDLGVHALLLMERAGIALADEAEKMLPEGKIVCLCGGGNNGGDGFVCARILKNRGRKVDVVCNADNLTQECRVNMEKWLSVGGDVWMEIPEDGNLLVDCLYGTGFHGTLSGMDAKSILHAKQLRDGGMKILSADIPSGVNGDNGQVLGAAIFADKTLCIGEIKAGVFLGDGIDHAGKVECVDIGIEVKADDSFAKLIDKDYAQALLPKRPRNSHKGDYGKVAIIAGSEAYTGAAYLATAAALRTGVGYTTLFLPEDLIPQFVLKMPEVLLKSVNKGTRYEFNESFLRKLKEYDCIAYGMGMGVDDDVAKGAVWLLCNYEGKLILDADGLNSLTRYGASLPALFRSKKCEILLTPHVQEFARLSKLDVTSIESSGLTQPKTFAEALDASILLKNAVSILSDGKRTAVNVTGCTGQAKAGSGDVLAGVIAGLSASGLSVFEAGALGSYLTGKAAEFAAEELGVYSMTASDIIAYLGRAFKYISED